MDFVFGSVRYEQVLGEDAAFGVVGIVASIAGEGVVVRVARCESTS